MTITKNKSDITEVRVGSNNPKRWTAKDTALLVAQARANDRKRTPAQRIKNEIMAIRYEMEHYLANNNPSSKPMTLDKVVTNYLRILGLPFRKFAIFLDTTDGNLKKYISGERRFNTDLAMKFGYFFHTSPELWLQLQLKNELYVLRKEKKQVRYYKKYDYRRILEQTSK